MKLYTSIWNDCYKLHMHYSKAETRKNRYWVSDLVHDTVVIYNRYGRTKFVNSLLLAIMADLEERYPMAKGGGH